MQEEGSGPVAQGNSCHSGFKSREKGCRGISRLQRGVCRLFFEIGIAIVLEKLGCMVLQGEGFDHSAQSRERSSMYYGLLISVVVNE